MVGAEFGYREILNKDPKHFETLHYLAILEAQSGRLDESLEHLNRALKINPRSLEARMSESNVLKALNRPKEALASCERALKIKPDFAPAHYRRGNMLLEIGRLAEALASYDRVVALTPANAEVLYNRGVALQQLKRHDEALASYEQALAIAPGDAEVLVNRGIVLYELGRYEQALASYEQALAIKPDLVEALNNRANVLLELKRPLDALASCDQALLIKPDYVEALNNRGKALYELKRYEDALASCGRALVIEPDFVEALTNRASVLRELHRPEKAEASCRQALALKPDFAEAHYNLGNALQDQGALDKAIASYRNALSFRPDYADAHSNLGNALTEQGDPDAAVASCRRAIELNPDHVGAHNNLGNALQKQGQFDASIASYRHALSLKPDFAEAHNNLGNTRHLQGQLDEAIVSYRQALSLTPDYAEAHSNLLFCLNYHPDLPAQEIFAEYQRWNDCHARPLAHAVAHTNSRDPQRRLRIGYVSPDLRRHSTRHFIEPLLAHHDKARVEVYAYAQVVIEDDVSTRFKTYVDHWRSTVGLSDDALAALIRRDGIDVLVDLAGHTSGNRLLVFARKPAPLQVSWLGYGYTTGLEAMDYFFADKTFAPAGCEALFAEKLVRLPVFAAYRPAEGMGEVGTLPALHTKALTLGTLSRSVRLNHRVIRTWAAILHRLPDARLLINSVTMQDATLQSQMREQFAAHGISSDRLLLGYDSPPWDVLRTIDISLDCFPHNSGTTLFESLYLGVPYVTLADRPSVGRLGAAILQALGHPEWIAANEEEYIDKTVALASDLERLAALRAGLRPLMQRSALMDEAAFARSVETAYLSFWQQWCQR